MKSITDERKAEIMEQLPTVPDGADFKVHKLDIVSLPHPYCITPGHVAVASDQFSGMLGEAAIEEAERQGIYCDICRSQGQIVPWHEHVSQLTLFIVVEHHVLNEIAGLHQYLLKVKDADLGIEGFAFPKPNQLKG